MEITITTESITKIKEFYFLIYILLINIYGILIMAFDKKKASKNKWRMRERNIFITALAGGSVGVMMGMIMYHHKTQHSTFTFGIPILFILNLISGCSLFYWIYIV